MAPLPPSWRLHQVVRSLLFPSGPLIDELPRSESANGKLTLLDLGCGQGVLLALVRRDRPDLHLVGIDLSEEKIAGAKRAFADLNDVELQVKDIADFPAKSADIITIVDVMYLVPFAEWRGILKRVYDCLRPGGVLLMKEMDRSLRWKFRLLQLEETLAVRVFRLTLGRSGAFSFPSAEEIDMLLRQVGFEVERRALDRGYIAPHCLWTCRKSG